MAGYANYSKSNNAIDAESRNCYPATEIARRLRVKTGAVKALLEPGEWHHTGLMFRETDYYDLDEAQENIDALRAWKAPVQIIEKFENCTVEYLEWGGTRRRPRATEIKIEGCRIEKRGDWCHITTPAGRKFKKNINTRGFSFTV